MSRRAGAILFFAALAGGGCGRRALYEWRDEPYLRPVYASGEGAARARMASRFADERDIGCRVLSVIGREAARAGDEEKAREAARVLMKHCEYESNPVVRSVILGLCLRNVGAGNAEVTDFLKGRVAFGGESASAAYALAALDSPGAFESIAARYRHAHQGRPNLRRNLTYGAVGDYGLRYELLGALWLLGDARGVGVLEEALAEMRRPWTSWPEKIHHMRRAECARALSSRLETLKASVAAETSLPGPAEQPTAVRKPQMDASLRPFGALGASHPTPAAGPQGRVARTEGPSGWPDAYAAEGSAKGEAGEP